MLFLHLFKKRKAIAPTADKPIKTIRNPLLDHGPAGGLIIKLQRYSVLGWIVAAVVIALHFFILLVSVLIPRPVMVVDQGGNFIGQIEFLKPSARSDQEIIAGSMHYVALCQSLNSATIYDDMAGCMNLQTPDLQAATAMALKKDNLLHRIEKLKARSWVEFGTGSGDVAIVSRKAGESKVRIKGNLFLDMGQKYIEPKPFDVTITVRPAARTTKNTSGILISESRDN